MKYKPAFLFDFQKTNNHNVTRPKQNYYSRSYKVQMNKTNANYCLQVQLEGTITSVYYLDSAF